MLLQHDRYFTVSVSPKKNMFNVLMFVFGVDRFDVTNLPVEDDATKHMLCLGNIKI